jgi:cytochrome b561
MIGSAGSDQSLVYDRRTIALHWASAALVLLAWGMAQIIDDFPRGPLRIDARSVHFVFGLSLAVVLCLRIAHRAASGRRLPAADAGFLHVVAKAVHYALYVLMIAQVLLGISWALLRGDSVFNLFAVGPLPLDKSVKDNVGDLHGTIATIILIVAGLHAAAGLFHHYVWRDGTLRRMIPGLRARG